VARIAPGCARTTAGPWRDEAHGCAPPCPGARAAELAALAETRSLVGRVRRPRGAIAAWLATEGGERSLLTARLGPTRPGSQWRRCEGQIPGDGNDGRCRSTGDGPATFFPHGLDFATGSSAGWTRPASTGARAMVDHLRPATGRPTGRRVTEDPTSVAGVGTGTPRAAAEHRPLLFIATPTRRYSLHSTRQHPDLTARGQRPRWKASTAAVASLRTTPATRG